MGYIYKITNDVNNKVYIGKTEYVEPVKRWKEHLQDYKKRKCEKRPLYAAMNKYGEEHFSFEIIEETYSPEETCQREQYWIEKFRTYVGFKDCNGYNATLGGDGKCYLNLDDSEVIKYHTEEASYIVNRTAKYFMVDRETIKKILVKNNILWLKNIHSNQLKTYEENGGVFQIDIKTKFILNIFENTTTASKYINGNKSTIKCACCAVRGSHYAYGYLWYYGKDLRQSIDNGEIVYI